MVEVGAGGPGGDEAVDRASPSFAQGAVPFLLFHAPVIKFIDDPFFFEQNARSFHGFAVVAKNDTGFITDGAKQFEEGVHFILVIREYLFQSQVEGSGAFQEIEFAGFGESDEIGYHDRFRRRSEDWCG